MKRDAHHRAWSLLLLVGLLWSPSLRGQSGLYIPSAKPVKNMQKALHNPPTFCLLIKYANDSVAEYGESDLDLLDSAYRIAFAIANPNLYTMHVESYGNGNEALGAARVAAVVSYFAKRTYTTVPIRYAHNPIHCSCHGDSVETLRYEVPLTTAVYDCAQLPEARRMLNKSIALGNSVLVTFRNDPDECVGAARGCYVPAADSVVRGYYAWMALSKGSLYAVGGTKDTCPGSVEITIDDHLDYKTIVEHYNLVPHRKQIIVSAGYIVVKSNYGRRPDECEEEQVDSIFIRIPATKEQVEGKLRFFAKVKGSHGVEYKSLPTRKMPGKGDLVLQAPIDVAQFDTIYVGKRIKDNELSDYFYEVKGVPEAAAFRVGKKFYVAYRVDKHGKYEMKKALRNLFRIVPDQEEMPIEKQPADDRMKGEEIIED